MPSRTRRPRGDGYDPAVVASLVVDLTGAWSDGHVEGRAVRFGGNRINQIEMIYSSTVRHSAETVLYHRKTAK